MPLNLKHALVLLQDLLMDDCVQIVLIVLHQTIRLSPLSSALCGSPLFSIKCWRHTNFSIYLVSADVLGNVL